MITTLPIQIDARFRHRIPVVTILIIALSLIGQMRATSTVQQAIVNELNIRGKLIHDLWESDSYLKLPPDVAFDLFSPNRYAELSNLGKQTPAATTRRLKRSRKRLQKALQESVKDYRILKKKKQANRLGLSPANGFLSTSWFSHPFFHRSGLATFFSLFFLSAVLVLLELLIGYRVALLIVVLGIIMRALVYYFINPNAVAAIFGIFGATLSCGGALALFLRNNDFWISHSGNGSKKNYGVTDPSRMPTRVRASFWSGWVILACLVDITQLGLGNNFIALIICFFIGGTAAFLLELMGISSQKPMISMMPAVVPSSAAFQEGSPSRRGTASLAGESEETKNPIHQSETKGFKADVDHDIYKIQQQGSLENHLKKNSLDLFDDQGHVIGVNSNPVKETLKLQPVDGKFTGRVTIAEGRQGYALLLSNTGTQYILNTDLIQKIHIANIQQTVGSPIPVLDIVYAPDIDPTKIVLLRFLGSTMGAETLFAPGATWQQAFFGLLAELMKNSCGDVIPSRQEVLTGVFPTFLTLEHFHEQAYGG